MSELIVQVREKSIEAVHNGDIKALYELLENHHGELTDEIEQGLYGNILDLSLEMLTDTLEAKSKLSLEDESHYYTLRALYEYSISHYSSKKYLEAKALFEVLAEVAKEKKFSDAMKIHEAAAYLNIHIDEFIDKYCVVNDKLEDFYIKEFTKDVEVLCEKVKQTKASK